MVRQAARPDEAGQAQQPPYARRHEVRWRRAADPVHRSREVRTSQALHDAIVAYKVTILETTLSNIVSLKAGMGNGLGVYQAAVDARHKLLETAKNVSNEDFVAALMAADFLGAKK